MIASASETKRAIAENGFVIKKRLGQNFLIDERVLSKIIAAADVGPDDVVLEVGPGVGALTQALAEHARKVVAIEIDGALVQILQKNMAAYTNVQIVHGDALKVDLGAFIAGNSSVKAVANLPYYIATPVIMRLLEHPFREIVVMIQKEVAERLSAAPGTKSYGSLTLATRYRAGVSVVANVPRNCFIPRPNVDSAVTRFSLWEEKPVAPKDEAFMFAVIRAAFSTRRKTLVNCLSRCGFSSSKGDLAAVLQTCGLDVNTRGESLSLEQFARLSDALQG